MIDIRHCDNLDLMAEIENNTIDLIYCDILYGTGRKFKDYQDLKPKREIIEAHYIPRTKEMHRILKDTGSIYLQMDTKINHWVRCILDDVFGYENFRSEISWKRVNSVGSSKSMFDLIPNCTDRILIYAKSSKTTIKAIKTEYSPNTIKRYNKEDAKGKYAWQPLKTYSKEKLLYLKEKGLFKDKGKTKYHKYKLYLDKNKGVLIGDLWTDIPMLNQLSKERLGYDTQKPEALIERIIKASSNEGDLVADFYAGSFTTAKVCKDLNRNFIGCDISEKAVSIGLGRVRDTYDSEWTFG